MATLSIKSFVLWFINGLVPFVLVMNIQEGIQDDIRAKVDLITSNTKILYAILLSAWTAVSILLLLIKHQKEQEILKRAKIEREIKEIELKKLKDENN